MTQTDLRRWPSAGQTSTAGIFCLALALCTVTVAWGAEPPVVQAPQGPNVDARIAYNAGFKAAPAIHQLRKEEALRSALPNLAVTYDELTGATRTLVNPTGYLTGPGTAKSDAVTQAVDFVVANLDLLGLAPSDLRDLETTDIVVSRATGATHVYLRQRHLGLPVYNAQLHVNVNRDGRLLSVNNSLLPGLAGIAAAKSAVPETSAAFAVQQAASSLGIDLASAQLKSLDSGPGGRVVLAAADLSREPVEARLMWLPIRSGDARLVWNFQVSTLDDQHLFDFNVDAASGQVWTRFDWVSDAQYRVYPRPVESPNHTVPSPPADGRILVVNPEDATASPGGWFNAGTTIMAGNNVHACSDAVSNNICDAGEPSCGAGLVCDFPIDLTSAPALSTAAAITNLFYWNNTIHDIQYQYGFDEAAGNFQENNFGRGGIGGDSVNADAQDGSGLCNANFATPPDGGNPRMQMFLCTNTVPAADGDYDNAVIVHEYGHGISIRQVGGPSNSSCLNNLQQAGEGWSDWFALVYTAEAGDLGTDARGIGTYLFGQPANGPGIRDLPYSTDPAINNWTYESVRGASIPHGVGSRWAQVLWEVYWALVGQHGFDGDLLNPAPGWAGNQRALLYVNEGLKSTICSPTFVNNRDGILQAAVDNFAGEDVCLLWQVFADFGLGTDAISGGPNSTFPTNGFSMPPECQAPANSPPGVVISAPADNARFDQFQPVTFSGSATDAEDGDLSANLVWTSDFDGVIGTGASFTTTTLSANRHQITASVTDSGGLGGSAVLQRIEIRQGNPPANADPVVTITAPAGGSTFASGSVVAFAGSATDVEDGDLTAGLSWTSSIDGAIGAGGSFSVALSDGNHTITASVTDSAGNNGSDSISITVGNPPPPPADSVTITKAEWDSGKSELSVEGTVTSTTSTLTATFGARTEPVPNDAGRFRATFTNVTANPGTVTVTSSGGGSDTATVIGN